MYTQERSEILVYTDLPAETDREDRWGKSYAHLFGFEPTRATRASQGVLKSPNNTTKVWDMVMKFSRLLK